MRGLLSILAVTIVGNPHAFHAERPPCRLQRGILWTLGGTEEPCRHAIDGGATIQLYVLVKLFGPTNSLTSAIAGSAPRKNTHGISSWCSCVVTSEGHEVFVPSTSAFRV